MTPIKFKKINKRVQQVSIDNILKHLFGSSATQHLAWEEILNDGDKKKVKQISKQAKHGNKRQAYLDYVEASHYLRITKQSNKMSDVDFKDYVLQSIYHNKIEALSKYIWTKQSCKVIAQQCQMSVDQVKKLHDNQYLIHCYNLQQGHKHQIQAGETRYQLQHQYQRPSQYIYYDYGLRGLSGDSTEFQNKTVCKAYQMILKQLQKNNFIRQVIASQLERKHTIHLNGFKLATSDNKNRPFTLKNIRLLKKQRPFKSEIMATLASAGLISHRYGNKGRIIYYRNSEYKSLKAIAKAQRHIDKIDAKTYGYNNHYINLIKEKALALKMVNRNND